METSSEQPPSEAAAPSQPPELAPPPGADTSHPPPSATPSAATADARPSSSSPAAADPASAPSSSSQNPSQTPQSQPQLQQQPQPQPQPQPPRPPAQAVARPQAPFPHFVHHFTSASSSPSPSLSGPQSSSVGPSRPLISPTSSLATTTMPKGGLAIGVPAHGTHLPRPQQSPMSFPQFGQSPSFSQPFASLPRVPDQSAAANSQVRPPIQGIQNIGMIGSLSSSTQIRPGGSSNPQQRLAQTPLRAPSPPSNQAFSSQKIPGPTLLRGTSIASPSSSSPVTQPQSVSVQGKQMNAPSVLSTSHRPQGRPHVMQQRPSNLQQPSHTLSTTPQQLTLAAQQQQQPQKLHQPFQLQQQLQQQQQQQQLQQQQQQKQQLQQPQVPHQSQDLNQQSGQLRNQQQMPQQQPVRPFGPSAGRSNAQAGAVQTGSITPAVNTDADGSGNRILSKKSIQELFNQIDPSEDLDTTVEDVLIDIAEDFVESVATFACTLAKHRKSSTLEARDILLHAERNWNITIPGFSGDDIRGCKKQITNDIHKERLSVVKKSMLATSEPNTSRTPGTGQAGANQKAQGPKAPPP